MIPRRVIVAPKQYLNNPTLTIIIEVYSCTFTSKQCMYKNFHLDYYISEIIQQ